MGTTQSSGATTAYQGRFKIATTRPDTKERPFSANQNSAKRGNGAATSSKLGVNFQPVNLTADSGKSSKNERSFLKLDKKTPSSNFSKRRSSYDDQLK